jgi:glutaredoxin 3
VVDKLPDDIELFGTSTCPYTAELCERLMWDGRDVIEYDVETDPAALARMLELTGGQRTVPVLVEDGQVRQVGWRGLGCIVGGGLQTPCRQSAPDTNVRSKDRPDAGTSPSRECV